MNRDPDCRADHVKSSLEFYCKKDCSEIFPDHVAYFFSPHLDRHALSPAFGLGIPGMQ